MYSCPGSLAEVHLPLIHKITILLLVLILLYLLPKQLSSLSNRLRKSIGKGIDKKIEDLPKSARRIGEGIDGKIKFADDLLKTVGEGGDPLEKIEELGGDLLKSIGEPGGPLAKIEELAGKRVLEKCLSKTPAIEKTKEAETVERIGRRLAACARRSYIPFRFFLIDSPGIRNAYAIPGGSILITRALLDICRSEDEIAGVLAHEVAHIDCSHSLKRLGAALAIQNLVGINNLILSMATGLFEKLIECGYSQDNEFEADREGSLLAKRAEFDPLGLMELMKMEEDIYPAEEHSYFSTPPPRHERINELRKLFG